VKLKPSEAGYHNNLGAAYSRAKPSRLDDSIKAYQKAVELSPSDPTFQFNLATSYRRKEMYEEAQAAYEKSVGLDPGHADAWFDLGHVYKEPRCTKAVTAFPEVSRA
jgi:Flp pilus assembly protein TadD